MYACVCGGDGVPQERGRCAARPWKVCCKSVPAQIDCRWCCVNHAVTQERVGSQEGHGLVRQGAHDCQVCSGLPRCRRAGARLILAPLDCCCYCTIICIVLARIIIIKLLLGYFFLVHAAGLCGWCLLACLLPACLLPVLLNPPASDQVSNCFICQCSTA